MEDDIQGGRVNIDGVHYIRLTDKNYILCKSRISNGEKTRGQEVEDVVGYFTSLDGVFNRYFKECVVTRSAGLTMELSEFSRLLKEIKEDIKAIRKIMEL